jgi:hypothetical protein
MQETRTAAATLRRHARENRAERAGEPPRQHHAAALSIGLSAVIVAASIYEPRVLTIGLQSGSLPPGTRDPDAAEALPSGPLEAEHRTLEIGLRTWVERQTGQRLGYVEQLYTFGDRDRAMADGTGDAALALPALVVAYLALVREAGPAGSADAATGNAATGGASNGGAATSGAGNGVAEWRGWYRYFPWEDWRQGKPALLDPIEARLEGWAAEAGGEPERRLRAERLGLAFGRHGASWNEELVLERYELLYEAGLVAEAARGPGQIPGTQALAGGLPGTASAGVPGTGRPAAALDDGPQEVTAGVAMASDHRRILATALGRLRGKIKYRPVVFELMPPAFTLLQLQRTVEALAGVRLHKQNFRRLVEQQGLVEETGAISAATGGRPARLVRFRREVLLERPAPGLRLRAGRRAVAG